MTGERQRTLGDQDLRLRAVTAGDAEILYRWRMDDQSRHAFRSTETVPFDVHLAFLQAYLAGQGDDRWFVIEAAGDPVGAVALYGFSPDRQEAEWGRFVIDPAHRGRGLGTRALALLIEHAEGMALRRLTCEVLAGNAPAEGLYERAGFVDVGVSEADGRRFRRMALRLPRDA